MILTSTFDSFVSWFKCYTLAPPNMRHARIVEHEIQTHLVPRGDTSLNIHRNKGKHRKTDTGNLFSYFRLMKQICKKRNENNPSIVSSFKQSHIVRNNSSRLKKPSISEFHDFTSPFLFGYPLFKGEFIYLYYLKTIRAHLLLR